MALQRPPAPLEQDSRRHGYAYRAHVICDLPPKVVAAAGQPGCPLIWLFIPCHDPRRSTALPLALQNEIRLVRTSGMAAFSLRLPEGLERRLGEEARHCGQSRSELIREALEELLRRREQERFMAGLVAAAEVLASDASARAESLDLAADFLPADSEALALAEGGGVDASG